MPSILESKKEIILEIKNFSMSYQMQYYGAQTFRDTFVHALTSPVEFFFKDKDRMILLDHLNLKILKGERIGILGSNGSGKTSLCRYICGIHGNNQSIRINGIVKGIFDSEVAVLPELSGRENLKVLTHFFFPERSREERDEITADTIDFCDLGKFIDVPFKLYSKGMRSRLFLSLISSRPTDLLVLDEVFGGEDHFFNEKITALIKKTIADSGAVIFISHSNELIEEVCNRVIVFNDKKIVFDGGPSEGIEYYKNHCQRTRIQGA